MHPDDKISEWIWWKYPVSICGNCRSSSNNIRSRNLFVVNRSGQIMNETKPCITPLIITTQKTGWNLIISFRYIIDIISNYSVITSKAASLNKFSRVISSLLKNPGSEQVMSWKDFKDLSVPPKWIPFKEMNGNMLQLNWPPTLSHILVPSY